MRVAVKNHALPVYKKNRIASLLCILESTIRYNILSVFRPGKNRLLDMNNIKRTKYETFAYSGSAVAQW